MIWLYTYTYIDLYIFLIDNSSIIIDLKKKVYLCFFYSFDRLINKQVKKIIITNMDKCNRMSVWVNIVIYKHRGTI